MDLVMEEFGSKIQFNYNSHKRQNLICYNIGTSGSNLAKRIYDPSQLGQDSSNSS